MMDKDLRKYANGEFDPNAGKPHVNNGNVSTKSIYLKVWKRVIKEFKSLCIEIR